MLRAWVGKSHVLVFGSRVLDLKVYAHIHISSSSFAFAIIGLLTFKCLSSEYLIIRRWGIIRFKNMPVVNLGGLHHTLTSLLTTTAPFGSSLR